MIGELAEYWTEHNRTAFNDRRAKMGLPTGKEEKGTTKIKTSADFKWGGQKTPENKKNYGVWASRATQAKMYDWVATKKQTIQGIDEYFYVLTPDKSMYVQYYSKEEYDNYNSIVRKNIKEGKTGGDQYDGTIGIKTRPITFDELLRLNGSESGTLIEPNRVKGKGVEVWQGKISEDGTQIFKNGKWVNRDGSENIEAPLN